MPYLADNRLKCGSNPSIFLRAPVKFLTCMRPAGGLDLRQGKNWGFKHVGYRDTKELAALAYERAELETDGQAHPIFIADRG